MGTAADVYLAGSATSCRGVAPSTLELVGVLLSDHVGRASSCSWRGPRWGATAAAFTAAWLAVPPDFVLWWAQESRPHYHLTLVLGVLSLLLARRVPGASRRQRREGFVLRARDRARLLDESARDRLLPARPPVPRRGSLSPSQHPGSDPAARRLRPRRLPSPLARHSRGARAHRSRHRACRASSRTSPASARRGRSSPGRPRRPAGLELAAPGGSADGALSRTGECRDLEGRASSHRGASISRRSAS